MVSPSLAEAHANSAGLVGCRFGELFPSAVIGAMQVNKGGAGQAIERLLGVASGGRGRDFRDGELKTFRCDVDGYPIESIGLLQFGARFDKLLDCEPFEETALFHKLQSLLMLGVYKDGPAAQWKVTSAMRVVTSAESDWFAPIERSYREVVKRVLVELSAGRELSTITEDCLQIRVHDSRPYRPVFSERLQRQVANKQLGFYFPRATVIRMVDEYLTCEMD
ncbi:MAG: DNA mismatch repair protein MutH [Bradymonadia bacterium]